MRRLVAQGHAAPTGRLWPWHGRRGGIKIRRDNGWLDLPGDFRTA